MAPLNNATSRDVSAFLHRREPGDSLSQGWMRYRMMQPGIKLSLFGEETGWQVFAERRATRLRPAPGDAGTAEA